MKFKITISIIGVLLMYFIGGEEKKIHYNSGQVVALPLEQGESFLIQTFDHKKILICSGAFSQIIEILPQYTSFFDKTIDLLIIPPAKNTSWPVGIAMLDRFLIKKIILTNLFDQNPLFFEFIHRAQEKNIPITYAQKDLLIAQDFFLDLLSPLSPAAPGSFFLRLIYKKTPLFFFSYAKNRTAENSLLLSNQSLSAFTFKPSQQGSSSFTSNIYYQAIGPQQVVFVPDHTPENQFPHYEIIEKLASLKIFIAHQPASLVFPFN